MILIAFACTLALGCASGSVAFHALRDHHWALRLVAALGALWTAASSAYVAVIALFFVAVLEPWPLSIRQGPDTEFARERFEVHFREAPPESGYEIYCREEWGFGGDSITSLRFELDDPELIERLVERLGLERVEEGAEPSLRYLSASDWWPSEAVLNNSNEAYQRSGIDILWVDRETGRAYFQRANF